MESALQALRNGRPVLVHDDESRENEVDIIMPANCMSPEWMTFAIEYGSGLCCVSLPYERLVDLGFTRQGVGSLDNHETPFTNTTDYRVGTSSGVSATDRAETVQALVDPSSQIQNFSKSGHILTLAYTSGGVFQRRGHTEASLDLCRLADPTCKGAFLTELQNSDGSMTRLETAQLIAARFQLPLISIQQIVDAVSASTPKPQITRLVTKSNFYSQYWEGSAALHLYDCNLDGEVKYVLVKGEVHQQENVLTRIHSECFTGDLLGSLHCDCGAQLRQFYSLLDQEERGILIYLKGQEGRGIGPVDKIRAYNLQDTGLDTLEANIQLGYPTDARSYWQSAAILKDLGVQSINLCTNNPDKQISLGDLVSQITPLQTIPNLHNTLYLQTKRDKCRHTL